MAVLVRVRMQIVRTGGWKASEMSTLSSLRICGQVDLQASRLGYSGFGSSIFFSGWIFQLGASQQPFVHHLFIHIQFNLEPK